MGSPAVPGRAAAMWACFSLACILAQIPFIAFERAYFIKVEPYFSSPVTPFKNTLLLRNDSYGKGAFGASRNGGRAHQGIDILAPVGEQILASKSGRVLAASEDKGYGRFIEIFHPDGLKTCYAHLSQTLVKKGDWVKRGRVIGISGKSGNAANPRISPHLHFEIRSKSEALNPSNFLDPAVSLVNKNL